MSDSDPDIRDTAAVVPPLRPWLLDTVLPFWAETGADREQGGFFERLGPDRRPVRDDPKSLLVQARQTYVFSHAHLLGAPAWALESARHGFVFLMARGWDRTDGGWFHAFSRAGRPADITKDTYDHTFVLLAMAWLHRATGEGEPLDLARRTIGFMDRRLVDPHGAGYHEFIREGLLDIPLPRRQNPHMHLFEALLALFEATGDGEWLDRASGVLDLLDRHFLDHDTGSLGEFFTLDWRPAPEPDGGWREPGHHLEWVWLLHQYARMAGTGRGLDIADRLYRFALAHGVEPDPARPFAAYEGVGRRGEIRRDTKRLWPQTEALKAHLAVHERTGDPAARDRAERQLTALFRHFLGADHPGFHELLSREGAPVDPWMPTTSLYHLFIGIVEAMRVLGR